MTKYDEIIYWHRRYYGPMTIAALVDWQTHEVQLAIYEYEVREGTRAQRQVRAG